MTPSSRPEDCLDALTDVLRGERAALVCVARREGVSDEDAVECVQDALCTFLTLHQRGQLEADRAEWGAFLMGIVKNAARNRRRRHALAKPHDDIDAAERASDGAAADELVERAENQVRLRACVAELCAIQRAVVTLRLLEERPGEDVAEALGITRGHVDVLAHRARAALRACMCRE